MKNFTFNIYPPWCNMEQRWIPKTHGCPETICDSLNLLGDNLNLVEVCSDSTWVSREAHLLTGEENKLIATSGSRFWTAIYGRWICIHNHPHPLQSHQGRERRREPRPPTWVTFKSALSPLIIITPGTYVQTDRERTRNPVSGGEQERERCSGREGTRGEKDKMRKNEIWWAEGALEPLSDAD